VKTIECGCELSPLGTLVSLCPTHGEHMRAARAIDAAPHNKSTDRQLQQDLVKLVAPLVLQRWSTVTHPDDCAQMTLMHVNALMARLD
jgi:hypothetical protein